MARLARTKEAKTPRKGVPLHPVEVRGGKAYIGARHIGLGRRKDKPDPRDSIARLPALPRAAEAALPDYKNWGDSTWRGDQGAFPHCVAYSATHRIENSPTTYPESGPVVDPTDVYARAQLIDEYAGENYDGTSVRAGAKVMLEKGFISEYQRITTLQELIDFLRRPASAGGGPVLIGIDWYSSMFSPVYEQDALGDYRWMLVPSGSAAGGHAVLVNGVNVPRMTFRILNSWGRDWGVDGRASMRFSDMEDLLFSQGGDAWRYVEKRPVA
jgi:C1A family cysteine protease